MADDKDVSLEDELNRLRLENKKLNREVKRARKDNEFMRKANEQATRTYAYIQKENMRHVFFNKQLLMTSPYVLLLIDDKLEIVMASELFYSFSSYDVEKINAGVNLRDAIAEFLDDNNLDEFMEKCNLALEGNDIAPYLLHNEINGQHMDLQTSICPMKQEGTVVGINIVFVDMTEIIDSKKRADAANHAKSSFLANMSHEIRTPINAMLGMDEMILRESKEQGILSYAEDIRTAGKTLLALINEILDFSKVEEGKMEILPVKYELGSLISDLVNMINERANKKGLSFVTEIDDNIPHELYGDEIRLKQCVLNILNNAVKYTEKGQVKLLVSYRYKDEKSIYLIFSVEDTGIGMKKEDMDKLFSPFARIEEKRNRVIEGTGLGMSITKKLLELMGTSLSVQSTYGVGSTFSFEVEQDVVNSESLAAFAGRSIKRSSRSSRRRESKVTFTAPDAKILVIDDSDMNLRVIRSLLKRTQVQIETVSSGKEALEHTEKEIYDIVFIDHMMPEMDGIETLKNMKNQKNYDKSYHIVLTANAISGAREMYLEQGFDDYLSKPIDGDILDKVMQKYLPDEKIISAGKKEKENSKKIPQYSEKLNTEPHNMKDHSEWKFIPQNPGESPALYENIPLLDTQRGIDYCGSKEIYFTVIKTFHDSSKEHCDLLLKYYDNKDWLNFLLEIHSVKNTSNIVGGIRLNVLAEFMERAVQEKNYEYIHDHIEIVIDVYKRLGKMLENYI